MMTLSLFPRIRRRCVGLLSPRPCLLVADPRQPCHGYAQSVALKLKGGRQRPLLRPSSLLFLSLCLLRVSWPAADVFFPDRSLPVDKLFPARTFAKPASHTCSSLCAQTRTGRLKPRCVTPTTCTRAQEVGNTSCGCPCIDNTCSLCPELGTPKPSP